MHSAIVFVIIASTLVGQSIQDFVSVSDAIALGNSNKYYAMGCSGLTAELLGKPYKSANGYRQGAYIGVDSSYSGVSPGELVGFPGHVAIYTGQPGCKFVDVPAPARNSRCLKNGYGSQPVYKYYY